MFLSDDDWMNVVMVKESPQFQMWAPLWIGTEASETGRMTVPVVKSTSGWHHWQMRISPQEETESNKVENYQIMISVQPHSSYICRHLHPHGFREVHAVTELVGRILDAALLVEGNPWQHI